MKRNKKLFIVVGVVVVVIVGGLVVFDQYSATQKSDVLASIPKESTVAVPEPDATDIEQEATNQIPTLAAAGSQSHAVYTSYSETGAEGYLTYEAAPDNPASFTAVKDADGKWNVTEYKVLGETDIK